MSRQPDTKVVTPRAPATAFAPAHAEHQRPVPRRVPRPAAADPPAVATRSPLGRWFSPALAVVLATLALVTLRHQLQAWGYHEILRTVHALPRASIAAAIALTLAAYAALPGYDLLALRYVGRPQAVHRTALTSLIAFAFSQNLGFAALTGVSIRYRFWSAWGLSAAEVAQGVAFTLVTFWLGVLTLGAMLFLVVPMPPALTRVLPGHAPRLAGLAMLIPVLGYVVWNARARSPLTVRGWRFRAPGLGLAAAQVVVSTVDWALAGIVLWVLLPPRTVSFGAFLAVFLVGQIGGLVSHVPGGLGVFETLVLALLAPHVPAPRVFAALLAYRAVYYVAPFAIAATGFATFELLQRRAGVARVLRIAGRWVPGTAPYFLSLITFAAGTVLLVSGVTPSLHSRLGWLVGIVPYPVVEVSHFTASIAGVGLVLLALGIRRRLDAAYHLTVAALGVGIVASLLKGADFEEAIALTVALAAILPARAHFYRKAALWNEPFTPGWVAAVLLVLGGTIWLGLFNYRHVDYSGALFWRFALRADAPRFLRATVGVSGVAVAFALNRLLRPAVVRPVAPTLDDLARARAIATACPDVTANLALLGDKTLVFSDDERAFLMYGVEGRSWVALGDPIGPRDQQLELGWRFRELADRHGGWPVFYEVGCTLLPLYIDLGLTLLKLGEEARVPLATFSLDGGPRKGLRRAVRDVEKAGVQFELVPAAGVPPLLPELRRVSDDWLAARRMREKGFSLGFFDDHYLRQFPLALARRGERIVAFANIWSATDGTLSVDLMRYDHDAPSSVMDYLFVSLMRWGREQGYEWFNLGMAPLSGFERRALAPAWHRVGSLVYRHGEHFYRFRGLRQYKEKFDPVWQPRYLASPGGLALPRILANVASLVSRGSAGVIRP